MTDSRTSITCPRCGRTSHHPKDVEEGYCGNCHDWTSQRQKPVDMGRSEDNTTSVLGVGRSTDASHCHYGGGGEPRCQNAPGYEVVWVSTDELGRPRHSLCCLEHATMAASMGPTAVRIVRPIEEIDG